MNVKIRKLILIAMLTFAIVMLLEITSDAASLVASPSSVNVGDPVKITVSGIENVDGFQCEVTIKWGDNSQSGPQTIVHVNHEGFTSAGETTFTAKSAGTAEVSGVVKESSDPSITSVSGTTFGVKDSTPQPQPVSLSSIAITKAPDKTTYTEGETFNKAGMTVTATYSDGTKKAVNGYSISPSGSLKSGDKAVTISYTEGGVTQTATQTIMVNAKPQDTNTNANTSRNNTTGKNNTVANNTIEPEVVNPTFRAVNEKVYAVNSCNVRSSCSTATNNNKIGSLEKDELVIRTGVSSEWSKIVFNGKDAYVATKLLTTTPPDDEENTVEENTVENEISNELDTIKSEVGVLPEVGNNVSVQLFFVTTMISISIISSFIYLKIKEK